MSVPNFMALHPIGVETFHFTLNVVPVHLIDAAISQGEKLHLLIAPDGKSRPRAGFLRWAPRTSGPNFMTFQGKNSQDQKSNFITNHLHQNFMAICVLFESGAKARTKKAFKLKIGFLCIALHI